MSEQLFDSCYISKSPTKFDPVACARINCLQIRPANLGSAVKCVPSLSGVHTEVQAS